MQPGFFIDVLPREPNVVCKSVAVRRFAEGDLGLAPSSGFGFPGDPAFVIGQFLRGAEVVTLVEGDVFRLERRRLAVEFAVPEWVQREFVAAEVGGEERLAVGGGREVDVAG